MDDVKRIRWSVTSTSDKRESGMRGIISWRARSGRARMLTFWKTARLSCVLRATCYGLLTIAVFLDGIAHGEVRALGSFCFFCLHLQRILARERGKWPSAFFLGSGQRVCICFVHAISINLVRDSVGSPV
jgi:hypothetical protein